MKHRVTIAPDGATGSNRGGWSAIENQAVTTDFAQFGVTAQDASAIADVVDIASYGFAHQLGNGDFQGNHLGSDGMFVADFGHTLLLLGASSWYQNDSSTQAFEGRIANFRQKERVALSFIMANQTNFERDSDAANRIVRYADAYYFGGKALADESAMAVGKSFLRTFLADQSPDGTFNELGGFDSSYQCASIYLGEMLFMNMPPGDPLRDRLWAALRRGIERERQALTPTGAISTYHNTRTGSDSLWAIRTGQVYGLDGAHAAMAFEYYAAITGIPQDLNDARLVANHYFPQSLP